MPAVQKVLKKAGWTVDDVDLFELNEAFAAQAVAVQQELAVPDEKVRFPSISLLLSVRFFVSVMVEYTDIVFFLSPKFRSGLNTHLQNSFEIKLFFQNLVFIDH